MSWFLFCLRSFTQWNKIMIILHKCKCTHLTVDLLTPVEITSSCLSPNKDRVDDFPHGPLVVHDSGLQFNLEVHHRWPAVPAWKAKSISKDFFYIFKTFVYILNCRESISKNSIIYLFSCVFECGEYWNKGTSCYKQGIKKWYLFTCNPVLFSLTLT